MISRLDKGESRASRKRRRPLRGLRRPKRPKRRRIERRNLGGLQVPRFTSLQLCQFITGNSCGLLAGQVAAATIMRHFFLFFSSFVSAQSSLQACTAATLGTDNFLTLTACNIGVGQSCALGLAQVRQRQTLPQSPPSQTLPPPPSPLPTPPLPPTPYRCAPSSTPTPPPPAQPTGPTGRVGPPTGPTPRTIPTSARTPWPGDR